MSLCAGKTKAGKPCGMPPIAGSDYCFNHTTGLDAARSAARARGGKARHKQQARSEARKRAARKLDRGVLDHWATLDSAREIHEALLEVARRVADGDLGSREANACTAALKIALKNEIERCTRMGVNPWCPPWSLDDEDADDEDADDEDADALDLTKYDPGDVLAADDDDDDDDDDDEAGA